MGTLFAVAVTILALGFLWFYIARPILEDYGILRSIPESVNHSQDSVMSRSEDKPSVDPLSSKDGQSAGRTDSPTYDRAELLMFYTLLRKYGVPREEARPVLKLIRVPLSNDVWAKAQPPEPAQVTPIAGRPTDADFPYEPIGQ